MVERAGNRRSLVLWGACAAVLVPLAVMLACQYSWLTKLERTSKVARLATLDNYADAIVKEVEWAYVRRAEQSLDLPSYLVRHACLRDVSELFEKKAVDGVKRFFIVTYFDELPGTLYLKDPETGSMTPTDEGDEAAAVHLATADWRHSVEQGTGEQGSAVGSRRGPGGFYVGDLDPANPVIFNPVQAPDGHVVGLAGMIVDRAHFEREVLPAAVEKSLPRLSGLDRVFATVKDAEGRLVWPSKASPLAEPDVERRLAFVFPGWRVGLDGLHESPDEWARAHFVANMTLSVGLALALLAGVALALRTAARQMKLSEMKGDFVSNVSHELRTPLASIRLFGELMRLGRVREEHQVREFGEYIDNESRRLTQLVNNILDFSKIESGRRLYRFAPVAVEDAVTVALKTCEVALGQRGGRITFTVAPRLPDLEVDADALVQAVSNLLDNAVKYAGEAPPRIAVRIAHRGREVVIEVEDRGIGIAPEERSRIFERFHRVGTGLVHDVKGSGLGLAIVRHIAEAHGGRVSVESELGRGSTFAIHLPAPAIEPAIERTVEPAAPRIADLSPEGGRA